MNGSKDASTGAIELSKGEDGRRTRNAMSIFYNRKYLKYESLPQRNGGNTTKSSESLKVDWNALKFVLTTV